MSARFRWLSAPGPCAISMVAVEELPAAALDRALPSPGAACFARLLDCTRAVVDEVVVWHLEGGELELSLHGGPGVRAAVARCLGEHGLREAGPLVESSLALATQEPSWWAALAQAPSPGAARWLMQHRLQPPPFAADFLRRPAVVLLTGGVNAGKSTLLNCWSGRARALVSERPGTTRDLVTAETMVAGWRVRLVDSAGMRQTEDVLERAGQDLVRQARAQCDLVLTLLLPGERPGETGPKDLLVQGKADTLSTQDPTHGALPWSSIGIPGQSPGDLLQGLERALLNRLHLPALPPER